MFFYVFVVINRGTLIRLKNKKTVISITSPIENVRREKMRSRRVLGNSYYNSFYSRGIEIVLQRLM